ncbi:MAG TPA: hypothetical protein PLK06_03975 [bacterium]|nr:hypothetical protein [bacterium]
MSFIDSLKAMFSGKAKTPAEKEDCCAHDHGDAHAVKSCCEDKDGACCKVVPQSEGVDDCDCGHDHDAK